MNRTKCFSAFAAETKPTNALEVTKTNELTSLADSELDVVAGGLSRGRAGASAGRGGVGASRAKKYG